MRSSASTSTLRVPSGSLSICSTRARVPVLYKSSSLGSSLPLSFWVTSAIVRSPFIAVRTERIVSGRPMKSGRTVWGNTTRSRMGSNGACIGAACVTLTFSVIKEFLVIEKSFPDCLYGDNLGLFQDGWCRGESRSGRHSPCVESIVRTKAAAQP